MRPSNRRHVLFRVIDRITALFVGTAPLHWLSVVDQEPGDLRSVTITLHEVEGRTYITDLHSRAPGWGEDARSAGWGTLTTSRTDTRITLTAVTDPVLERQVLALRYGSTRGNLRLFHESGPGHLEVTPAGVATYAAAALGYGGHLRRGAGACQLRQRQVARSVGYASDIAYQGRWRSRQVAFGVGGVADRGAPSCTR